MANLLWKNREEYGDKGGENLNGHCKIKVRRATARRRNLPDQKPAYAGF